MAMAAVLAGCTAGTAQRSASPIASAPTPSPATATTPSPTVDGQIAPLVAQADGMSLTVTLDRTTLAPGEAVEFTARFQNDSDEAMDYYVPWCGGAAEGRVTVALPLEPVGKRWTGIAQVFKDYVLTEAYGPGGVPALEPVSLDVIAQPCEEGQFEEVLGPGESVTTKMPWKAEIVPGVDALSGSVPFTVSAGYDLQNGPPSRDPGDTGPPGSWVRMYKQLSVTGTLEVIGDEPDLAGPGEVINSLLADRKFSRWLAQEPKETWSNANLFLTSSPAGEGIVPAGPSWDIDLFREVGVPRHWVIAFLDPFDASVRSVTYCNVPCDR